MESVSVERPVSLHLWGKDHWSTLAYAETCAVDGQALEIARMRCDWERHPSLISSMHSLSGKKYPTRLAGGVDLEDHDDWDCLYDAQNAGLLTIQGAMSDAFEVQPGRRGHIDVHGPRKERTNGRWETGRKITVKFTPRGLAVVSALRAHKADGGSFGTFSVCLKCGGSGRLPARQNEYGDQRTVDCYDCNGIGVPQRS